MPGHERTRRILWSWLGARASEQMDGKMGSFYEFGTLADTFRLDVKKRRLTHNWQRNHCYAKGTRRVVVVVAEQWKCTGKGPSHESSLA